MQPRTFFIIPAHGNTKLVSCFFITKSTTNTLYANKLPRDEAVAKRDGIPLPAFFPEDAFVHGIFIIVSATGN